MSGLTAEYLGTLAAVVASSVVLLSFLDHLVTKQASPRRSGFELKAEAVASTLEVSPTVGRLAARAAGAANVAVLAAPAVLLAAPGTLPAVLAGICVTFGSYTIYLLVAVRRSASGCGCSAGEQGAPVTSWTVLRAVAPLSVAAISMLAGAERAMLPREFVELATGGLAATAMAALVWTLPTALDQGRLCRLSRGGDFLSEAQAWRARQPA